MRLTPIEEETYRWQMWVSDFGAAGQEKLRNASVLISRVGGLGSLVAYELAAAGIGKLVLAHAGNVTPSDLNRQLLMTHDWIGKPRIESAKRRLLELNPRLDIVALATNINGTNAGEIVAQADLVVDCAPLFEERFEMNRQAVLQKKPMIECAMYDLEASLTTIVPGQSACLACLSPAPPENWRREFPVFGAVSGTVGCMAAMEAIKVIAGFGQPLLNTLLTIDLRNMQFKRRSIARNPNCSICSG